MYACAVLICELARMSFTSLQIYIFLSQVCVPHCCIASNIVDLKAKFSITEDDRIFNAAPLTFDPSIVEVQCYP